MEPFNAFSHPYNTKNNQYNGGSLLNSKKSGDSAISIGWLTQENFGVNGILPTLALCFKKDRYAVAGVGKLLTEIGTYSRSYAGGTGVGSATFINSSGFVENTPINVIRKHHDPVTGVLQGINLEQQGTNSIRASEDMSNADWVAVGGTKVFDAAVINPRGVAGAWFLQEDGSTGNHEIQINVRTDAAGGNSVSDWVKAKGVTEVRIGMWNSTNGDYAWAIANLTTGAITSTGGAQLKGTPRLEVFPGGWFRLHLSGQATTVKAESLRIRLIRAGSQSYTGDGVSGLYMWGAQNQQNCLITLSYIASFGSAGSITRGQDLFTVPDISSWYVTEGTLVARFKADQTGLATTRAIVSLDDGTTNNHLTLSLRDNNSDVIGMDLVAATVAEYTDSVATYIQGQQGIVALAYKANDVLGAYNTTAAGLDVAAAIPTLTQMVLGASKAASSAGNIILQDVLFYPVRMTSMELEAITNSLTFGDMDNA